MKTRIEFGSGHVSIICSKEMATAIGTAMVVAYEGWQEDASVKPFPVDIEFAIRVGNTLEQGKDFEEEEPASHA